MSSSSDVAAPGVLDCDFWVQKATFELVGPYLDPSWREWLRLGSGEARAVLAAGQVGTGLALPESRYFTEGAAVASAGASDDPRALVPPYLDRPEIAGAIFNPGIANAVVGLGNRLLANELAVAANRWTDDWLGTDRRLLGTILVSLRDPRAAAAEIRRAKGSNDRMAQVMVAFPDRLLGDRALDPVFDAACECDLPVVLTAGGAYSERIGGLTPVGHPTSHFEELVSWEYGAQPHLISLIARGTFDRHPSLHLTFNGFGVAWMPSLIWRLDLEYRAGRVDAPRLSRLPSEQIREGIRLTTAQLELPSNVDALADLISSVEGEAMLLYASGPLRGSQLSDPTSPVALPPTWLDAISQNSRALFGRR